MKNHGYRRTPNLGGAVNFLAEISNRNGEQAEMFPEFPIVKNCQKLSSGGKGPKIRHLRVFS